MALPDGSYVKEDGNPLTMADMEIQADKRNSRLPPGIFLSEFRAWENQAQQQNALQRMQAALGQRSQQGLLGAMGNQQQRLTGLSGNEALANILGPAGSTRIGLGIAADFGILPSGGYNIGADVAKEPKKEIEIPMQQPTGKRKIILVD